jgi:hypothetical protein
MFGSNRASLLPHNLNVGAMVQSPFFVRQSKLASFLKDCDEDTLGPLPGVCIPAPPPRVDTTGGASSTPPGVHTDRIPPVPTPTLEPSLPLTASKKRHLDRVDSEPSTPPRDGSTCSSSDMADGSEADDNWRCYRRHFLRTGWPTGRGIINQMKRFPDGRVPCEGTRLEWSIAIFRCIIRTGSRRMDHKIGLCYDAKVRWEFYSDESTENTWRPDFMVLVERPSTRQAAGFLEAGLIHIVTNDQRHSANSINMRRRDKGGEGPRRKPGLPHYIYICIRFL